MSLFRSALAGLALAVVLTQAPTAFVFAQTAPASPLMAAVDTVASVSERDLVRRFYAARANALAWSTGSSLNQDSIFALTALRSAGDEGIDPARFDIDALTKPDSSGDAVARDIRMTTALLRYASDMTNGRPDLRALDRDVDLPRDNRDLAFGLANGLRDHQLYEFFRSLEPATPEYAALKIALANYRKIDSQGGWGVITAKGPFHAPDAALDVLTALKLRLAYEDSALDPAQPPSADEMDAAVQRFQLRNGLDADGEVGSKTLALLNESASQRALTVAANMERLRWLPHRPERVRIVVNIPDARLAVVDGDKEVLSSAVIVGKPRTPTPIFRAQITQVIANPSWNVPAAIARGEILPRVARDPGYLARHNMIIVDGQVRQLPGAKNALGQLKVDLDDRFSVYLHDTPSRNLFDRRQRFLSHGCVRVAQIYPLASYALTGDTTAGMAQLVAAVATSGTLRLSVKDRIPVYLVYATVFPSADGLQFRSDVYGRDRRLIAAMTAGKQFAAADPSCPPRG